MDMDHAPAWVEALPLIGKGLLVLLALPVVFFLVGVMVFSQEPPGSSFWGTDKPRWWEVVIGTTLIGFISSVVLSAIFGSTYLIYQLLGWLNRGKDWGVAFVVSLLGVLFGVYYWFEGRHIK